MREKLIQKGIPGEEISFIHEAGTEAQKAELFAKVRSGKVRVLLGSTAKLGAGTNLQNRLIALYHLDAPWRPADLFQQEGRILRQGNQNKKVKIFRYVTEATFDAYLWQILENKQKFISQIMTSKSPVRACEDVDDTALSYAEVKALATGNPFIKEKMTLDMEVSKLRLMKASYNSQKYRLEDQIARSYPKQIKALEEKIAELYEDVSAAALILEKDKRKNAFSMEICGENYTDKKQAGVALMAACTGLTLAKQEEEIASFHEFRLSAYFESFSQKFILTLRRRCSYRMEMGNDPSGNIQRIYHLIAGIEQRLLEDKRTLENVKQQLKTAQEEVKKPFLKEQELKDKTARLAELDALLNLDETEMMENQKMVGDNENESENSPVKEENRKEKPDNRNEVTITGTKEISEKVPDYVAENSSGYYGQKLMTLSDLKAIQRETAKKRKEIQHQQHHGKREGYSR